MTRLVRVIGICSVGLVIGLIIHRPRVGSPSANAPDKASTKLLAREADAEVGDVICNPNGGGWAPEAFTRVLLILTSSQCAACSEDAEFHERLYDDAMRSGLFPLYVLSDRPDQDEAARRLAGKTRTVVRSDLTRLGFTRTPMIAVLSSSGVVQSLWVGSAAPEIREHLFMDLLSGESIYRYEHISRGEFEAGARSSKVIQAVALSKPVHGFASPGVSYRVIPPDELDVRVRYELDLKSPIAVDCDTARSSYGCQEALYRLRSSRIGGRLYAVGQPRRSSHCEDFRAR